MKISDNNAIPNGVKQPYLLTTKELVSDFGINSYDFGARMQDMQLGRWWSVDPMADKWNSYSPYSYAVNNPANVIDPDGRDAVYSYDNKSNTLTISAKIYYQGKDLPKDAKERETLMAKINSDLKAIYKDGTGGSGDTQWNVKFDVTAEVNEDAKQENLKAGENIMTVDNDSPGLIQDDGTKRQNVSGEKNNMGYLLGKAGTSYDPHEIGHMLGFTDRYTDYGSVDGKNWRSISHDGFKNDIMNAFSSTSLNQSHYDAAVQYANYKINIGQRNLLPGLRSNSVNVTNVYDSQMPSSSTSNKDIPAGWIKR